MFMPMECIHDEHTWHSASAITRQVNQIDNPDAFNHTVRVATVLAAHAFNLEGVRLIKDGIVEDQISVCRLNERCSGLLPQ